MPSVTYIHANGNATKLDVAVGTSVMKAAVNNRTPGIVGECGGQLQCATCHVYVNEENILPLPPISEDEDEMLGAAATERTEHSRLSCQLICSPEIDGLVVHTPKTQY